MLLEPLTSSTVFHQHIYQMNPTVQLISSLMVVIACFPPYSGTPLCEKRSRCAFMWQMNDGKEAQGVAVVVVVQYRDPSLGEFPLGNMRAHSYLSRGYDGVLSEICGATLYLFSSCYKWSSALWVCAYTLEFDGSAMRCPLLSETGPVWYSEPRVYLLYLLSAVSSSENWWKMNAEWFMHCTTGTSLLLLWRGRNTTESTKCGERWSACWAARLTSWSLR